jgi:predicted transcriptional regulator YdeE
MKNYFSFIGIATICTMNSTVLCQEFTTNKPHFTQEMTMQDYKIIQKPTIMVIGIECRTSNAPEAAPHDIPKHWEKFYKNDTINQIPNKTSSEVIALYCDYEGDYTQPYSLVIGCPVDSLDDIPKGMVAKTIPNGSYAIFRAIGDHPKSLIETWGYIWQQPTLERTYTGDYEVYGDKFSNSPPEVEVYIAIEQEKVRHLEGVQLKESKIGQFDDGIGAFANRDFKKGK